MHPRKRRSRTQPDGSRRGNSPKCTANSPRFARLVLHRSLYTAFHGHEETFSPYADFPPRCIEPYQNRNTSRTCHTAVPVIAVDVT
jgi:hypothetical protein